jgi:hypothetical protein
VLQMPISVSHLLLREELFGVSNVRIFHGSMKGVGVLGISAAKRRVSSPFTARTRSYSKIRFANTSVFMYVEIPHLRNTLVELQNFRSSRVTLIRSPKSSLEIPFLGG